MLESRKLHKKNEDAFSPSCGDDAARADVTSPNQPDSTVTDGHLRISGLVIVVAAGLIILGLALQLALSGVAAGVLLLLGAALLAVSLYQTARAGQRRRRDAAAPNPALRRAEHESAMKSRLLATVSHDIRTPLSGIAGMSHLLSQTRLTPEQANYLTSIRQSADALSRLVDDLLDFSSIEAGRFQLHPQETDPRQLIESVVEMLAHRAHEKDVEVASWFSAEVPALLFLDPARLRQVLYNIIGNAVKFTVSGGVLVGASIDRDCMVITIRDNGPGMSEEDQARIFSEYEQAGSDQNKAAGTGLGLAISHCIVTQAGGTLTVESVKDVGSTFTIRLPVTLAGDAGARETRIRALAGSEVLVVAPKGVTLEALSETIDTLGGNCTCASTLEEAEAILAASAGRGHTITDLIADNRLADALSTRLQERPDLCSANTRRIFLVSPEARTERQFGAGYDSWLIRPLRERSLTGVLQGLMAGVELRDPLHDSRSNADSRWTQAGPSSQNILLGEDDPVNRLLMRTVMQKAGHKVQETDNFRALIAAATALPGRPDVIVSDLSMPGGDGFDTLAAIRNFERLNKLEELPIVVVTASEGAGVRSQAIEAGATTVLTKPADPKKLNELIASFGIRKAG